MLRRQSEFLAYQVMADPYGASGARDVERELLDAPEVPILDEEPLLILREIVPDDSFIGLLENWFVSLSARIERLVGAAANADLATVRDIAHEMSGTCGCFGALRLGELAWQLEQICRTGEVARARALVRTMVPVTAATRAALRRRYFCH
jgi:HPt (histidine-containing phosphotransfer) domain-containing protein